METIFYIAVGIVILISATVLISYFDVDGGKIKKSIKIIHRFPKRIYRAADRQANSLKGIPFINEDFPIREKHGHSNTGKLTFFTWWKTKPKKERRPQLDL